MKNVSQKFTKVSATGVCAAALALILLMGGLSGARADEADAKRLFKAMSDYMAAQKVISFDYDADLEIVTTDLQKITLASSGKAILDRPDKIRATRTGGFADVELLFDSKTLTILGKNANRYAQIDIPGTIDHLIDELRRTYNMPLPAADLLMADVYDQLMPEVIDIKDLGSGVIAGVECDHLAFRTDKVDWQIWIAQGDRPYLCRYVITSKLMAQGPQYTIQVRNWKTGNEVTADDFSFKNPTNAQKIDFKDLPERDEMPKNFMMGGAK